MPPDVHSPSSPSQALADLHLSLHGHSAPDTPPPPIVNGFKPTINGFHHTPTEDALDPIGKLQQELERTRKERDEFATQYQNLLGKLQTMRNTLGNKLKQDAVSAPCAQSPISELRTHARSLSHAQPLGGARSTRAAHSTADSAQRRP
jgi:hypothetical protein